MTEYSEAVERQKILIEAEKWAKQINQIHFHSLTSMYYDTVETKEELIKNGPVTDTTYNSGLIIGRRNNKEETIKKKQEETRSDALKTFVGN